MTEPDHDALQSDDGLEALALADLDDLASSVISRDLYAVYGEAPDQQILLHSSNCQALFSIRINALVGESHEMPGLGRMTLVGVARWVASRHQAVATAKMLKSACDHFDRWLDGPHPFRLWTGEHEVETTMPPRVLISYAANLAKHPLLGLSRKLQQLQDLLQRGGHPKPSIEDTLCMVGGFHEEIIDRTVYHATTMAELAFDLFAAAHGLRSALASRWKDDRSASSGARRLRHDLRPFGTFDPDVRRPLRPTTSRHLQKCYGVPR